MRIVHASAEVEPWCKTGGLADVVGSLPNAEARLAPPGSRVLVLCPLHRGVREVAARRGETLVDAGYALAPIPGGPVGRVLVVDTATPELTVGFIDCPQLFDRPGIYDDANRVAWRDNAERFSWFARAVIEVAPALLGGRPDVLHAHDWHLGLAPYWMRRAGGPWAEARAVFTIHNILYQGVFPKAMVPRLGLSWHNFTIDGYEWCDNLSFLKAGIAFADAVTTVSPGHADELLTPQGGAGLHGFLAAQGDRFSGILNGLDPSMWDPGTDPALPVSFTAHDQAGRAGCRAALLAEMGLPDAGGLLLGVVSRLVWNKGLDIVVDALERSDAQLVVLGNGEAHLEERFRRLAQRHPDRVAVLIGFDGSLARRIFAGCDAILVPSRVEPCGLTQLQAMRYGSVPIAHPVGGLADTVVDPGDAALARGEGTGLLFAPHAPGPLVNAIHRAQRLHRDPGGWSALLTACMEHDSSWTVSATRTLALTPPLHAGVRP